MPRARVTTSRNKKRRASRALRGRSPTESLVESTVNGAGRVAARFFGRRAYVGAGAVGIATFLVADALGVGELAMALAGGYVAYRVLRDRVSIADAVKEGVKAKEGKGPAVREHGGARRRAAAAHAR